MLKASYVMERRVHSFPTDLSGWQVDCLHLFPADVVDDGGLLISHALLSRHVRGWRRAVDALHHVQVVLRG